MKKIGWVLLCAVFAVNSCWAQRSLSTQSKKAENFYFTGLEFYDTKFYDKAAQNLKSAIKEDPEFTEAYLILGEIYETSKQTDSAIKYYKSAVSLNPDIHPRALYNLGMLEFKQGLYFEAEEHLSEYLRYPIRSESTKQKANESLDKIRRAIRFVNNPVPFVPYNIGDSINTHFDEYLPALTADEKTLVITKRFYHIDELTKNQIFEEDFYVSYYNDSSGWSKAERMPEPVNSSGNEGAQSISPDGRYLYFTGCNRTDGYGSCDIYVSKRVGDTWGKPFNLWEPINTSFWESQPSIAPDGKTLYFASNRPEGKGSSDIWVSVLQDNGTWSEPQNLGDSINTTGSETSPFIHPDNKTLYFASDGHDGLGGKDIFYSRKKDDGTWSKPHNLGYPINTHKDEISMIVNSAGDIAYFSSDKPGGKGGQDIYYFELYREARPLAVSYMKGKLFDAKSHLPIEGKLDIINLRTGEVVASADSDTETGDFLVTLPTEEKYAVNVSKDGYLFYSEHFESGSIADQIKPELIDVPLKAIEAGETMVLNNIFYETNAYKLEPESAVELNRLVKLLNQNPELKIEISGHTDNTGSEAVNLRLSENRAKSIYDYLVQQGISANRLTYVGYGFRKPVATNDTEEGRAKNRRTEILIIED